MINNIPSIDANKVLNISLEAVEGVGVLKDLTTDTEVARQNRIDLERFGYFGKNGILFIKLKNNIINPFQSELKNMLSKELLMKSRDYSSPDYSVSGVNAGPDFRPILFWKPAITIEANKTVTVDFYTSDDLGEYEIFIEGMSNGGKVFTTSQVFKIGKTSEN